MRDKDKPFEAPNDSSSKGTNLIPSNHREISRRPHDLVRRGLASIVTDEKRTIQFPEEYSLGKLYIDQVSQLTFRLRFHIPLRWVPAQGTITLAKNEELLLKIDPSLSDLSYFRNLSDAPLWGIRYGIRRPSSLRPFQLSVSTMASISCLSYLIALGLCSTRFNEDGLAHIGRITSLKILLLEHTEITDSGLAHLSKLINLEYLDLGFTEISGVGFANLSNLSKLKDLHFRFSRGISDDGLAHIGRLINLQQLSLQYTKITDGGLAHLSKLINLEYLDLTSTQITDAGIVHLEGMANLTWLYLGNTQVTDTGLAPLYARNDLNIVR